MDQDQGGAKLKSSEASATSDGIATVNNVQLRYVCRGNGQHPLLCIPGALGTPELHYQPLLDYLGQEGSGFKVVSFEPRGYGRSCDLKRHEVDAFSTDAEDGYELMMSLSLPTFSVLGWCDGGIAGIMMTTIHPQAVRKLIVFGTRSYITADELKVYEETRDISTWDAMSGVTVKMYGASILSRMWSEWLDALNGYYTKSKGDICTDALSQVSCPTLIVHGAKDGMCPLFHAEYLRDHVTGSRLVVMEQAKHMLHLKYHKEFNRLVEEFLNGPIS